MTTNKKIPLLVLCCFFMTNLYSQTENALMPNGLIVNSWFQFDTTGSYKNTSPMDVFQKQLIREVSFFSKNNLAHMIVEGITKKGIPVYNKYYDEMSLKKPKQLPLSEVKTRMGYRVDTVQVVDDKDNFITKAVPVEIKEENMKRLFFQERWSFDADAYKMTKDVISYWPICETYFTDIVTGEEIHKGYRPVGAIIPDPKLKDVFQPLLTVKYEFILENEELLTHRTDSPNNCFYQVTKEFGFKIENQWSPLFTSYSRNKLIDLLVDSVVTGKISAYDPNTGTKLSIADIKQNLGVRNDTLSNQYNPNISERDTVVLVTSGPMKGDIVSLVFTEEWFISPATLAIRKEVKAIAPVILIPKIDQTTGESISDFGWRKLTYVVKMK